MIILKAEIVVRGMPLDKHHSPPIRLRCLRRTNISHTHRVVISRTATYNSQNELIGLLGACAPLITSALDVASNIKLIRGAALQRRMPQSRANFICKIVAAVKPNILIELVEIIVKPKSKRVC
jgi:hypothetical protein